MKKSKKPAPKKKKASAKKKSAKKPAPVKAKKKATPIKSKRKSAPIAKKKTAKKASPIKKAVKKVIVKKKPTKRPVAKKPAPKSKSIAKQRKREPRPQLAMDFETVNTVQAPELSTPLPDSPFMDGLGEDLLNEAIQDTEDNMEADADNEIRNEADSSLTDTDGQ